MYIIPYYFMPDPPKGVAVDVFKIIDSIKNQTVQSEVRRIYVGAFVALIMCMISRSVFLYPLLTICYVSGKLVSKAKENFPPSVMVAIQRDADIYDYSPAPLRTARAWRIRSLWLNQRR